MTHDPDLVETVARAVALDHIRLEGVDPAELDTLIHHQPMWWEAMKSCTIAALSAIDASGTHWIETTKVYLDGFSQKDIDAIKQDLLKLGDAMERDQRENPGYHAMMRRIDEKDGR